MESSNSTNGYSVVNVRPEEFNRVEAGRISEDGITWYSAVTDCTKMAPVGGEKTTLFVWFRFPDDRMGEALAIEMARVINTAYTCGVLDRDNRVLVPAEILKEFESIAKVQYKRFEDAVSFKQQQLEDEN